MAVKAYQGQWSIMHSQINASHVLNLGIGSQHWAIFRSTLLDLSALSISLVSTLDLQLRAQLEAYPGRVWNQTQIPWPRGPSAGTPRPCPGPYAGCGLLPLIVNTIRCSGIEHRFPCLEGLQQGPQDPARVPMLGVAYSH